MNAKEAREIAETQLHGPVIAPYMEMIHQSIKSAAEAGRMSISHPFQGLALTYPSAQQQDAIWAALSIEGYVVKHHPDPDPGHPASGPYTEIAWG